MSTSLDSGGMIRLGAAHYNTLDEIEWFCEALRKEMKSLNG